MVQHRTSLRAQRRISLEEWEKLITAAKTNRDNGSLKPLLDAFRPTLLNLARQICPHHVKDGMAVGDIAIWKSLRKLRKGKTYRNRMRQYLYLAAVNAMRDFARKLRRQSRNEVLFVDLVYQGANCHMDRLPKPRAGRDDFGPAGREPQNDIKEYIKHIRDYLDVEGVLALYEQHQERFGHARGRHLWIDAKLHTHGALQRLCKRIAEDVEIYGCSINIQRLIQASPRARQKTYK